jgi:hypothetical protein
VTKPSLAEYIHELDIEGQLAWDIENLSDWRAFRRALKVIDLANKSYWRTAIRKNEDEVYVAMLLLLLPNLRVLRLDLPSRPSFLVAAVDQATTVIPSYSSRASLQSLRHLFLYARDHTTPCDAIYLEPFFNIHHLESTRVCHLDSSNTRSWTFEPSSCDISTLAFNYSCIRGSLLRQIFASCRAVKSLRYESSGHVHTGRPSHRFNGPAMGVALRPLAKSLENLKIDIRQSQIEQITAAALNNLSSLQAYLHLKKLTSSLRILIGPEPATSVAQLTSALPSSLEILDVLGFGREHWKTHCEQIEELVERKERWRLRLRKIKLRTVLDTRRKRYVRTLVSDAIWGISYCRS